MYKTRLQPGHLPQEHLSFLTSFIITKYLKLEVDDNLRVCGDEHSPCDFSLTGYNTKIYQFHVIKK